jgi:LysM repeat protein/ABC-type branched-subunit amino acid transport system substrate-binding protein
MLSAQEPDRDQRITENGKTYLLHKVLPGETLYSIGKHYDVEIQLIKDENPQIGGGLKSGEVIKIPDVRAENNKVRESGPGKPSHFISYTVRRKETLYNISRKYGITIDQILEYNRGISDLRKGDELRIPQWETEPAGQVSVVEKAAKREVNSNVHIVMTGDNWYAIARKYGVSFTSLRESNPDIQQLKPGIRLSLPGKTAVGGEKSQEAGEFTDHRIARGETLYSISRNFNVSADRLVELNPFLKKGCKAGKVIRIPVTGKGSGTLPREGDTPLIGKNPDSKPSSDDKTATGSRSEVKKASECLPDPIPDRDKQTVKVALLLPLFLADNKTLNEQLLENYHNGDRIVPEVVSDTLRTDTKMSSQLQFQGNSENFIHFYEGALLAIDSLQQSGIKVELEVWDTEQKASKIRNLVSSSVLNNAAMIIGPVYPNEQKEITEFASGHRIPLISPLSPSDEFAKGNDYFFQVNPSKEYIARKTGEYIISTYNNSNLIVLQTSNSGSESESEADRLRQELTEKGGKGNRTTISVYNFRKDGYAGLHEKMVKDRKNVLVLPTVNEAEVSVVFSNMKNLSAEFDVTVVGNSRFPQLESIDPEYFHMGKLEFLTPYWPDMNMEVTRSFINKFRLYYRTDPNQYSIQGYDVTFFFVKALVDFGNDFRKCITSEKAGLVQGTYRFSKSSSGGYLNKGISVIQYLPAFEIVRKTILND